jgi:hypothetical protein
LRLTLKKGKDAFIYAFEDGKVKEVTDIGTDDCFHAY